MSETETHLGKLRKIDLQGQTVGEWCEAKCRETGITALERWNKNWIDQMLDSEIGANQYFIAGDEIWEKVEHTKVDSDGDIDFMTINPDDTVTFVMQFYNGGTCLSEMIEESLKKLKK